MTTRRGTFGKSIFLSSLEAFHIIFMSQEVGFEYKSVFGSGILFMDPDPTHEKNGSRIQGGKGKDYFQLFFQVERG